MLMTSEVDQILSDLSCALPPAKTSTVIWMMNNQWMRMNILILQINIPYTLIVLDIVYNIIPYISLSHCNSDNSHSLTATVINDLIVAIPYLFPCSRSFTTGKSIFTSLTRAPLGLVNCQHPPTEQLGLVNGQYPPEWGQLYYCSFFMADTETELVWARHID